ncbi:MAG TPA: hypothetical protein VD837_17715 [Terriglobales bacterium]|nr:hypothetical protein [Terriglobales bacterium]
MLVYAVTIFLSAFLLFQVQPVLAKYILPWFGGTPAVWTTCILFFQVLLLGGYAYSHALTTRFAARRQVIVHGAVLLISLLCMAIAAVLWPTPIMPGPSWKPQGADLPAWHIFSLLLVSVGLPYFLLSTTGPLLQAWFAQSEQGRSPYRLYALSNFGSLLALISYPFIVEPALSLRVQGWTWSAGYVAFALGLWLCGKRLNKSALAVGGSPQRGTSQTRTRLRAGTSAMWIALPACASVMLLASTNQICQEVAVVPFLWVLPLVLYLLSFIICFDNERWYKRAIFHPALFVSILAAFYVLYDSSSPIVVQIAIYSLLLFSICMVCHGELVRIKPDASNLTAFYLMISLGGALGGLFVAVVAPYVFRGFWELYIGIFAALALTFVALVRDQNSWLKRRNPAIAFGLLVFTLLLPEVVRIAMKLTAQEASRLSSYRLAAGLVALLMAVVFLRKKQSNLSLRHPGWVSQLAMVLLVGVVGSMLLANAKSHASSSLLTTRNFYGSLAVTVADADSPEMRSYILRHGRILHGLQFADNEKRPKPTSYFGPRSGIGLLLTNHPQRFGAELQGLRIGIIGLGIGTMSAYGRTGDTIRYYEINPEVTRLASDPHGYFTYLRDCQAELEIIPGDARLSMEREVESGNSQQFDVLAIDAFSADTIPVHLLTREAFEIYLRQLKPGGIIAVHISNRYLDLRPVLWRQSEEFKLTFGWIHSGIELPLNSMSDWVLLTRDERMLQVPAIAQAIVPHTEFKRPPLWTDDYSNLFQMLRHDQLGGDLLGTILPH